MSVRKKVTWNAGQIPENNRMIRRPVYTPEPEIHDAELREAWKRSYVGQIFISKHHLVDINGSWHRSGYPHPVLTPTNDPHYMNPSGTNFVPSQHPMIYLGKTYVDCMGSKSRIISRPYTTILFGGCKYLVNDPNSLIPIEE